MIGMVRKGSTGRSGAERGVTLIEILITLTIIALMSGIAAFGLGASSTARMKQAATQISGAIRIAYAHSISTSKSVRLVFDFTSGKTTLEESSAPHLVKNDIAGGAAPATEMENEAQAAGAWVVDGPHAPRAQFSSSKAFGFPAAGAELPSGIGFWQVETSHQDLPIGEGRGYLYFFPTGQTENAAIQVRISNSDETVDANFMTVLVSPLTGKTMVKRGRISPPKPRNDDEASERQDSVFH